MRTHEQRLHGDLLITPKRGALRRMLVLSGSLAVAVAYFMLSALPAFSADTGTVSATVTAAAPCLTLSVSAIGFGAAAFSTSSTVVDIENNQVAFTNCSAQAENVAARATKPVGQQKTTWNLDEFAGTSCPGNENVLALWSVATGPQVFVNTIWTTNRYYVDQNANQFSFPAGSTTQTTTTLRMPCTGSSGSGEQMSFEIIYTASF